VSKSRGALRAIVGSLSEQLARGWACLAAARQIQSERPGLLPGRSQAFLDTTYAACVESAILAFARLVLSHKDSISVTYLLNCVQQSPSAFPVSEREAVARAVEQHRVLLNEMLPLVDQVKDYRDRAIAHLDKKVVNHRRAVHAHPPVELGEVERAFALLLELLNGYRDALGLPELELDPPESDPVGTFASGRDDRAPTTDPP
jgi:hypothetical protein